MERPSQQLMFSRINLIMGFYSLEQVKKILPSGKKICTGHFMEHGHASIKLHATNLDCKDLLAML